MCVVLYTAVLLATLGDASVAGGGLRLTDQANTSASVLTPLDRVRTISAGIGSALITLRRPFNALLWFDVRFEVLMGSAKHHGGYGLSFCLGDLDASQPFGEEGAGNGLCVLFRTWRTPRPPYETIEVWYAREALLIFDVGKSLRTSSWVPVHIRHDEDGLCATYGVHMLCLCRSFFDAGPWPAIRRYVSHNARAWIEHYKLRGWAPSPSWQSTSTLP